MCLCSVVEGKAFTESVCCDGGGMWKAQDIEREEKMWKVNILNILVMKDLSEETHEKEVKIRRMRRL